MHAHLLDMDEIRDLLKNYRYKTRFMSSPTTQIRQTRRNTRTILPHLKPFTCSSHPLAQPPQKKPSIQEDNHDNQLTSEQQQHIKATTTWETGNIDTTLLTSQPPPSLLNARKVCGGVRNIPPIDPELLEQVQACEQDAREVLAKADKELFSTTYRRDFNDRYMHLVDTRPHTGSRSPMTEGSVMREEAPSVETPQPKYYFTSTSDHYRRPIIIPCLTNKTTRFGYNHRYVKVSNGGVPGTDSNSYTNPEFITPLYKSDYTNPHGR